MINTCFTDGEFNCLKNAVEGIILDTSAKNDHVGDIQRVVQTVKDQICAIRSLPSCTLEIVAFALMWLNAFPPMGGIYTTYSSRNNILSSQLDYNKHC